MKGHVAAVLLAFAAQSHGRSDKLQLTNLEELTRVADANGTANSCGAFQGILGPPSTFTSATAIFTVPKVSLRSGQDFAKFTPNVTPRIVVSVGIDGIMCPETVRAGTYSTILSNGTQVNQPFLEFNNMTRIATRPTVQAGDTIGVMIVAEMPGSTLIHWENQRTGESFEYEPSTGILCGKTVSWQVEDILPSKAGPGEYFAAFEPVRFSLVEGERADGVRVHLDGAATFTEDKPYCRGAQGGSTNELIVTSL